MDKGKDIAQVALKYIGKTEKPHNSGFNDPDLERRMKDVGWDKGASWCAYFAELVWKEAYQDNEGILAQIDKLFSGSATATYKNFDIAKWETSKTPKLGALAVWRFGNGWQGHIGIVVNEGDARTFETVEGNTNASGGREGIEVARKTRRLNQSLSLKGLNLIGFIYPK